MEFTKVKADTFETLQMNAGIVVDAFNPATGVVGNILGATTGGLTVAANPNFSDFGEDVDNCPANTWQMKRILSYDPSASGTFLSMTASLARKLAAAGTLATTKITPSHKLTQADFADVWIIGDYSNVNDGTSTAGYVAVHIMNALNTAGFKWTTTKDGKGQFAFEFHGHYDYDNIDAVPFEIYVKAGTGSSTAPSITLNAHSITVADEATQQLVATVVPAGTTVTWSSASTTYATVSDGLVTGKSEGSTIITASITVDGVTYSDTCTVIVTA